MVSCEHNDPVQVVRRGLNLRHSDDRTMASAAILAERLDRVRRLGGVFEQIAFSPQMQTMLYRQPTGAVEAAV